MQVDDKQSYKGSLLYELAEGGECGGGGGRGASGPLRSPPRRSNLQPENRNAQKRSETHKYGRVHPVWPTGTAVASLLLAVSFIWIGHRKVGPFLPYTDTVFLRTWGSLCRSVPAHVGQLE